MDTNASDAKKLIEQLSESLSVEVKRWIDPDTAEGKAKIARAAIALRNFNGGYLVIGFDNDTMEPDTGNAPNDIRAAFHIDKVQGIVSRYASEPFEVSVEFPDSDGQIFPVLVIPSGVKTPVAAKSDLAQSGKKNLISVGDVYFRSLRSNNTPSTTKAQWSDWSSIMDICFDNREADIGRFLRRHLGSITTEQIGQIATAITTEIQPEPSSEELLHNYLQYSRERYNQVVEERQVALPEHGSWEVALIINGVAPRQHSANQDFLNLIRSSNPQYSGWPIWLDSSGLGPDKRPFVQEGVWESLLVRLNNMWGDGIDFIRLDPKGNFYQYRALEDDFTDLQRGPQRLTALDYGLQITRSVEAVAVGIAFSKAMGYEAESTVLSFAFRWSGLRNRRLNSWTRSMWYGGSTQEAYQDSLIRCISVPLDAPLSGIGGYVNQAIKPLFELFGGWAIEESTVENIANHTINRNR